MGRNIFGIILMYVVSRNIDLFLYFSFICFGFVVISFFIFLVLYFVFIDVILIMFLVNRILIMLNLLYIISFIINNIIRLNVMLMVKLLS